MSTTRQLDAIMFTDIVGYMALMSDDDDDLIREKETDSRPKDLIDIKQLKAKRKYE
jgi:hypothetical protein